MRRPATRSNAVRHRHRNKHGVWRKRRIGDKFEHSTDEHRTIKEAVRIFWEQHTEISAQQAVAAHATAEITELTRRVEMARFVLTAKE